MKFFLPILAALAAFAVATASAMTDPTETLEGVLDLGEREDSVCVRERQTLRSMENNTRMAGPLSRGPLGGRKAFAPVGARAPCRRDMIARS